MRHLGVRTGGLAAALILAMFPIAAQKRQPAAPPPPSSDEAVAREVHHELLMLPQYGVFDSLAYRMSGNTVTLTGQVTQPALKRDAEDVVSRIEGVARVENRIHVLPVSEIDWQVRRAVYAALYGDPDLSAEYGYRAMPPIHIVVENGHLTLVGAVSSESDRNRAGALAGHVPGVFSVANDLAVEK